MLGIVAKRVWFSKYGPGTWFPYSAISLALKPSDVATEPHHPEGQKPQSRDCSQLSGLNSLLTVCKWFVHAAKAFLGLWKTECSLESWQRQGFLGLTSLQWRKLKHHWGHPRLLIIRLVTCTCPAVWWFWPEYKVLVVSFPRHCVQGWGLQPLKCWISGKDTEAPTPASPLTQRRILPFQSSLSASRADHAIPKKKKRAK